MKLKINDAFYKLFFDWDFDILLCLGGYGSGKSHEMFTKLAYKCATEKRRVMVVRREYSTIKDSCYTDIEDAIDRLGINEYVISKKSPLTHYFKNGSEIIYRGMDTQRKVKSIKNIDLIVVEEANETEIVKLKELINRLRTKGIKSHIIMMTNPGTENDSIFQLFFREYAFNLEELYANKLVSKQSIIELDGKKETIKIKAHHSTYKDNKYLPATFIWNLENEQDEDLRTIAKEGRYGKTKGTVFNNVEKAAYVYKLIENKNVEWYNGLDFGVSVSYDVLTKCAIDTEENVLYIYDGIYKRGMETNELVFELSNKISGFENITADSEDPRLIKDLAGAGFSIKGAKKGAGSVKYGIMKLKSFKRIVIDEKLENMVTEQNGNNRGIYNDFKNLARKKLKDGTYSEDEFEIDPHAVDSVRYAIEKYKRFDYKDRSIRNPNA